MLKPRLPAYEIAEWKSKPWPERLRMVCLAWATQGYGTPPLIYLIYLLKIGFYVWMWSFFCSFTPGMGSLSAMGTWCWTAIAFQKAVLWSMAFEGLGLGCGSGPLTRRYLPPVGGFLYFLRPGTTKMPFAPGLPVFGGRTRTHLDIVLYLTHYIFLIRALMSPKLTFDLLLPTVVLLPLLGLTDKTLFLSARAEHYWTVLVCFLFASHWLVGAKLVWCGIWLWAATSKLNRHFPSVICVMISNSPFTNWGPIRRWMYKDFPDDLRPSRLAHVLAHFGTAVEYTFPVVLLLSTGGTSTQLGLVVMLGFHIFITSNIPMGVPIEWNVIMVYGAFYLFGVHADVSVFTGSSPWMLGFLAVMLLVIPAWGNFVPSMVSFLCSMRYYAGNWAYSIWLFRGDSAKKLDEHLVKSAPRVQEQLAHLYDEDTITAVISKVMAFRAMHLHGRALQALLPQVVDDLDEYEYLDGEIVAGVVLGWNFGEGHLHDLQLLEAIQAQCGYEEGELRCLFVESQPMLGRHHDWTIADAATGVIARGQIEVRGLLDLQPWPTESP